MERKVGAQLALVDGAELHEEVMWVLTVDERLAITRLSRLQKDWVATTPNGPWVEARHEPKVQLTAAELSTGHDHRPVEASPLARAARSTLAIVLAKQKSMDHDHPVPSHEMARGQYDGVGNPGGPRATAIHGDT